MNSAAAHPVRIMRARNLLAACCALGLLVPLGGCGVRLSAPPTTIPTLSPQAQLRDELSRREAAISKGALALVPPASAATPAPSTGLADTELTRLASRSQDRLTALGGVWTPWPQGAPPGADAGPAPRPLPADQAALLAELELSVKAAQVATAQEQDPALTQLYASLYVSYSLDADVLAAALQQPRTDQEPAAAPETPRPAGGEPTATPVVLSATATDALFQLQWYAETAAMRADADSQQRLLAAAADTRNQLTDSLRGGGPGPRVFTFPFDATRSDDQWVQQAAVTAIDALLQDLVASPAGSPGRQALLARLLHTARLARDFGISPTELLPLSPL